MPLEGQGFASAMKVAAVIVTWEAVRRWSDAFDPALARQLRNLSLLARAVISLPDRETVGAFEELNGPVIAETERRLAAALAARARECPTEAEAIHAAIAELGWTPGTLAASADAAGVKARAALRAAAEADDAEIFAHASEALARR